MTSSSDVTTSHLILHVADTQASIDFWCGALGATLESDEELEAPALDAIFERKGVRIRDTFMRIGGVRLHTIETLDVPRQREPSRGPAHSLGLTGISFRVPDLDEQHARAVHAGREPTPIHEFEGLEAPVRLFFVEDPDGVRVEMIEGEVQPAS